MVGGRESSDIAVLVVGCETGHAAHLSEAAFVKSRSMRSRQVNLPRLRWRTTPGSSEPGARRFNASACMAATSLSSGAQLSFSLCWMRCASAAGGDRCEHLAGFHVVAGIQRLCGGDHAVARRDHLRFHLHGANDQQRIASFHAIALVNANLQYGTCHGAGDRFVAGWHFQSCRGSAARSGAGAAYRGHAITVACWRSSANAPLSSPAGAGESRAGCSASKVVRRLRRVPPDGSRSI